MRRGARQFLCACIVPLGAMAAACAWGQPDVNVFNRLSFQAASSEAARTHKLVIVYLRGHAQAPDVKNGLGMVGGGQNAFALMDERTWKNPTLASWIKWHGIAVQVGESEQPDVFKELAKEFRGVGRSHADPAVYPHIGVFMDGNLVAVIPSAGYEEDRGWTQPNGLGMAHIEAWRSFPKPVGVLTELDHTLQLIAARNPVWMAEHERLNPAPEAPEWKLFHAAADGNAPAIEDPPIGEDLLKRLDQAREAKRGGDMYGATGLYTWFWERSDALDLIYRPARAACIAGEFAEIARKRPPTHSRLEDMRRTIEDRFLWWDGTDWLEYLLINEAMEDSAAPAATAARIVGDQDEDSLATPAEQATLDLLFSRKSWTGLAAPTADQLQWLAEQPSKLGVRSDKADVQELLVLRSRLFFDESCRVYAALLKAGREAEAKEVAQRLVSVSTRLSKRDEAEERLYTPAGARRALVATAVIAGQVRAEHADMLRQAAGEGQDDPHLRARVHDAAPAR